MGLEEQSLIVDSMLGRSVRMLLQKIFSMSETVLVVVAERLSARHLIPLRSRIAFVCMYVRHTLIVVWAMYVLGVRSP